MLRLRLEHRWLIGIRDTELKLVGEYGLRKFVTQILGCKAMRLHLKTERACAPHFVFPWTSLNNADLT